MALNKKEENRISARIYGCISLIAGLVLIVAAIGCSAAGSKIVSTVNESLVAEKTYFPPQGSPAFAAEDFPAAQKYASQQVNDGMKAKVFAEDYLGVQSKLLSGGKTSSEISAQLAADPQNMALAQLQGTLFQIETSKALLLSAHGAWSQGTALQAVSKAMAVAGAVLIVVAGVQIMRYKKLQ